MSGLRYSGWLKVIYLGFLLEQTQKFQIICLNNCHLIFKRFINLVPKTHTPDFLVLLIFAVSWNCIVLHAALHRALHRALLGPPEQHDGLSFNDTAQFENFVSKSLSYRIKLCVTSTPVTANMFCNKNSILISWTFWRTFHSRNCRFVT